ncbi:MAG: hypothetical protein GY851_31820 [bacterium]|nr:hypothetical protein [bacterium]
MCTTIRTSMALLCAIALAAMPALAADPIAIDDRLELFVDEYLIESTDGVALELHNPQPRELSIVFDEPWEGNTCCYVRVFQDGPLYRMYYRASNFDLETKEVSEQKVCYAVSVDGIHWDKPSLGLIEHEGSTDNNIMWTGIGVHNFAPFKDENPNCPPEAQYKALGGGEKGGLVAFTSPDAIHWTLVSEKPVISKGAFDSQNLAFYDTVRGRYVDFHRGFNNRVRDIMTCTSPDFASWTEPHYIDYGDTPPEHLYTNAIAPYYRAPHIFMGFPKRFVPSRDLKVHHYPGVSDGVFMTSRDGEHWNRWREAFIRPGLQTSRWVNRNNMTAWGIVVTRSDTPGLPDELSVYSSEGYYVGPCGMRRFTIRQDGFVSANAPATGGEFTTKVFTFTGDGQKADEAPAPRTVMRVTDTPLVGAQSIQFTKPSILSIPDTKDLGNQATFAVHLRKVPKGHRRLFSAYNGGALPTTKGEMWLDIDADGSVSDTKAAIRFAYNGVMVVATNEAVPDWSLESGNDAVHHIAATYNDGVIRLYFDGKPVAEGGKPGGGPIAFNLGDVQFGEDYEPAAQTNEPFLGFADDITVVRRALSPEEIASVAANGAAQLAKAAETGGAVYTCEGGEELTLANILAPDGTSDALLPGEPVPAETELILNYATSAAGSLRCEIQDAEGNPIPGFSLDDCSEIYGDHVERAVTWGKNRELAGFEGAPVRLRFVMSDADLYSIRFL